MCQMEQAAVKQESSAVLQSKTTLGSSKQQTSVSRLHFCKELSSSLTLLA